jgi:uncharacterized protein (UPF0335 family)
MTNKKSANEAPKKSGVSKKTDLKRTQTRTVSHISTAPSSAQSTSSSQQSSSIGIESIIRSSFSKMNEDMNSNFAKMNREIDQLKQNQEDIRTKQGLLFDKIESLEDSKKTINGFPKAVYDEAKSVGIELKVNFVSILSQYFIL